MLAATVPTSFPALFSDESVTAFTCSLSAVTTPAPISFTPPVVAVSVTAPAAVTGAPIVSDVLAASVTVPPVIVPVVVTALVLVTVTLPPGSLIPVIVSGLAVFVRLTFPPAVFVALKFDTVFAPFSVWPLTDVVCSSPPVLKNPPTPSVIALPEFAVIEPPLTAAFTASGPPVAVSVTAPAAVTGAPIVSDVLAASVTVPPVIVPVVVTALVLVTVTLPPGSLIPVIVSGLAVFVRLTFPPAVFVALKFDTVFAPFSVWPLTDVVCSSPPVLKNPPTPSVIALPEFAVIEPPLTAAFTASGPPVAVSVTAPAAVTGAPIVSDVLAASVTVPPVIVPVVVTAPVLVTVTLPPGSLIPVIVSGLAVFVRLTFPPAVFVALKFDTVFAPFSVWPLTDVVCSSPPVLKNPPTPSVIALPEFAVIEPPLTAAFTA